MREERVKMKSWIKENKTWLLPTGLLSFAGVPIVIYLLSSIPLLPIGGNNDWAGFWGGYLGAIIGAFVAIFVMKSTIDYERDIRQRDEKIRFLNEVSVTVAELAAKINKSNCDLLRFHKTGKEDWNYEAVYGLSEATKIESILQIKLLSQQENKYIGVIELNNKIREIANATVLLHEVNVQSFDELESESEDVSNKLSELLTVTYTFVMNNIE